MFLSLSSSGFVTPCPDLYPNHGQFFLLGLNSIKPFFLQPLLSIEGKSVTKSLAFLHVLIMFFIAGGGVVGR